MKTVAGPSYAIHRPTPIRPPKTAACQVSRSNRYSEPEPSPRTSPANTTPPRFTTWQSVDSDEENGQFRELAMIERELSRRNGPCPSQRWSYPFAARGALSRPNNPMVRDLIFEINKKEDNCRKYGGEDTDSTGSGVDQEEQQ